MRYFISTTARFRATEFLMRSFLNEMRTVPPPPGQPYGRVSDAGRYVWRHGSRLVPSMRAGGFGFGSVFSFIQRLSWPGSDYSTARLLRAISAWRFPILEHSLRVCTRDTWPLIRQRVCARLICHGTSWNDMSVLYIGRGDSIIRTQGSRPTYSECQLGTESRS